MQDFILLIQIYWPTLIAITLSSSLLSQLGAQIACRNQSLQVFCLSQASITGILASLLWVLAVGGDQALQASVESSHWFPTLSSIVTASLVVWMLTQMTRTRPSSITVFYIAAFGLLTALNALISRLFPSLETHFTQAFFGDLITLNLKMIYTISLSSFVLWVVYLKNWRLYTNESFELAYFGFSQFKSKVSLLLPIFAISYICINVQTIGLLATLSFLFLPTVIVSLFDIRKVTTHLIYVSLLSSCSSFVGFLFSLVLPQLPTTPTITLSMGFFGLAAYVVKKLKK